MNLMSSDSDKLTRLCLLFLHIIHSFFKVTIHFFFHHEVVANMLSIYPINYELDIDEAGKMIIIS